MTTSARPSVTLSSARFDLACARANLAKSEDALATALGYFRQANADLYEQIAEEKTRVENADASLRAIALKEYERLNVKKLIKGVEIITTKAYAIDEVEGLKWAHEHRTFLLPERLDTAGAKKVAQTGAMELPFVRITESPSVRVATDLSEFVADYEIVGEQAGEP